MLCTRLDPGSAFCLIYCDLTIHFSLVVKLAVFICACSFACSGYLQVDSNDCDS